MLFRKIKEERMIKESIAAENQMRSRFSEWANTMQRKVDIFLLYNHEQPTSKSWLIWNVIKEIAPITTLNSFELIYNNYPKAKDNIDRLVSGGNYDTDIAKKAIVYYGLGLFRMAIYMSNKPPMTPEQIGDFVKALKLDSADRQCVADESEAIFSNLKQRYKARKRGDELDPPTFYVPYILALTNLEFDEWQKMQFALLVPESEKFLEHNALTVAKAMGDAFLNGPYGVLLK